MNRMVEVTCTSILFYCLFTKKGEGAQWLSGRVLDSRPMGPRVRASPVSLRCGP